MANPFNAMNPSNPMNTNSLGYVKNLYQAVRNSNNPMQYFQMMAQNNPRLQPILNMLQNGGDPKQIFYNMCQQRGINPEEFLKALNS